MVKFKLQKLYMWLLIIGGINLGLLVFGFNLVESVLSRWPMGIIIVYLAIGISAVVMLFQMFGVIKKRK